MVGLGDVPQQTPRSKIPDPEVVNRTVAVPVGKVEKTVSNTNTGVETGTP